jgi:L-ornithine N5-oxygenase
MEHRYKLITDERCKAGIYMQGFCQASHGLSDTLLSILPIRADEIAGSLYEHGENRGHSRSMVDLLLATAS